MKTYVFSGLLLLWVLFIGLAFSAAAALPDEKLADPVLEARAEKLDILLRCVVCQSQSIGESNAPLARDMRILVRERIMLGETDEQVLAFFWERYGDYVLMKPPLQRNTFFLWFFPIIALGGGGIIAFLAIRKISQMEAAEDDGEDEV